MQIDSLEKLYVEELRDLYNAEKQILKALPKMVKAAANPELRKIFSDHLKQTEGHVQRLESICKTKKVSPLGKKCVGMAGVLAEGQELLEQDIEPDVLDVALIAAAQRVEHYEMAGYGCVRTYAKVLGDDEAAEALQRTLDEEGEADQALSRLAEYSINLEAAQESGR